MARRINIQTRTRILLLALLCAGGAIASVVSRPLGASSGTGSVDSQVGVGLPWWKKTLSHTVQEEWFFSAQMDLRYGPRWRTALPDKTVLRLYQQYCAEHVPQ